MEERSAWPPPVVDDQAIADTPLLQREQATLLPGHLIALSKPDWALWRWSCVRGSGFPIAQVLSLANSAYIKSIDDFLAQESLDDLLRQKLRQELSHLARESPAGLRSLLKKANRRIRQWEVPEALPSDQVDAIQKDLHAWSQVPIARKQAWEAIEHEFNLVWEKSITLLDKVVRDERFCTAVQWQNHKVFHTALLRFINTLAQSGARETNPRHWRLITKYLQRYCTKNDTIGFFGPVVWARWEEETPYLEAQPGPQLLASRSVYFETWVIDALGELLAQDRALLPWAIPRQMPFLHLEGSTLYIPFARPIALTPAQSLVLAACDGQKTAHEIAEQLLRRPQPGLTSRADVFAILERFRSTRRIAWTFEVSMEDWHPERTLRKQLERITLPLERRKALAMLDQLEQGRAAVADAADNPYKLDQAFEQLEATFTNLTHKAASRDAGKTYAARTLVYEDCQRAIDIKLGSKLLEELARPLTLLLTSARWFSQQAAQLYRQALHETYSKLVQETGSAIIDYSRFWSWIQPLFAPESETQIPEQLEAALQARWSTILNIPQDEHAVHYNSEQLRPLVEKAFQAAGPGWPTARYHSPDILISASGQEAIQQGDFQFVLGEFHQARNTLESIVLLSQCPDYAQLLEATARDFSRPRVIPVFTRHIFPTKRVYPALTQPDDWRFVFGTDSCAIPPAQALRTGDLVIEKRNGTLIVHTRDNSKQFEALEFFDSLISLQICDHFKFLAPRSHRPRVTIDRMVVCRESWSFQANSLPFAALEDPFIRIVEIRRWVHQHEIPRFVFLRTPTEKKPYFVDLESILSMDLLARSIRQSQTSDADKAFITITEMLPDPQHLWLSDSVGNRYTSELRLVAVDQSSASMPDERGSLS